MLGELNLDELDGQMQTHGQLHHMDVRRLIAELRASRKVVEAVIENRDWLHPNCSLDCGLCRIDEAISEYDRSLVNVRNEEAK